MKSGVTLFAICLLACAALLPFFTNSSALSAMPNPQAPGTVNCSSEDGRRKYCPVDVRDGVQLVNQRSGSPCTFGTTWGFDRRGIWVDRGCRADFLVGYNGGPGPGGPGGPGGGPGGWPGWGQKYNVYCSSDDGRRNVCPVDTRGGVRLVRQRSGAACVYGDSWGYDNRGLWVDRGCRADFEIGQAGWQPPASSVIYCASDDGRRNYCKTNTGGSPRIIRQRSDADCIYRQTWGFDQRGIWVDRGCRADFQIGR
jgi:Protein of unknown function (DUF3011)